jgi:hypothetical protein
VNRVVSLITEDRLAEAVDLLLKYYDKSYRFSQEKYKGTRPVLIRSTTAEAMKNADLIIKTINESILA